MNHESNTEAAEDDEISLLDLLQVIAENLRLLILAPIGLGLAALAISFGLAPTYTASTVFMPPQQQQGSAAMMLQSLGALGGVAGAAAGIKSPNDQYVSLLKSDAVANALIGRFGLLEQFELKSLTDARAQLDGVSKITSGKDGLIVVSVDNGSPKLAADIANAYVEELRTLLARLAVTEAQQRRVFFETQLEATKRNLSIAETALRSSGVNSSALKSSPVATISAVAQVQAQIAAQEVKVASMRGYLTESAPDFKQAMTELSALRTQFAKLEKPSPVDGDNAGYVGRVRDVKYYETLFELFAKQYELARVDEAREGALIQVVDAAVPPEKKSKPKKALIATLVTLASFFVLLLFVFMRHAVRNAVADPELAEKLLRLRHAARRSIGVN
ncbi:Wzz/FepE/Etk N-terminal domain-containing protein [Rhodoferax sp. TBRC 17660]|uniref:Wzz/FepE/Etk N-terminal domain-containing protein n=1 Tax=Rhodoferax potami TaxID=3068338 RepID=A0ABU3KS27_9BURK|nr:Wzz/FepE/Etk N-terminal domain-containing protein [Rhodoferax sp. TBRC 17660]MDT7520293.1 Wzz/FepE/Etk N-terminal domain-containing protein [Rhodoferax sp. TBRC 17660]